MSSFFVTGMSQNFDEQRVFGYYETLKEAEEAVLENRCDINEAGSYPFVVIEEYRSGLYPIAKGESWYRWSQDGKFAGQGAYHKIEKPEDKKDYCNFGIG